MARIIRTPQANDDLFSIWEYITLRNPPAADQLIRRFDEAFRTLAANIDRPGLFETVRPLPPFRSGPDPERRDA